MPHPLIEGTSLKKSYGLQSVLEDVSFLISEGQKIALIGRNGAGKSTLLRLLTQEESAEEGTIHRYERARIGVVKQHELLPHDCQTLIFLQDASGKAHWEVQKLASQFGLAMNHLEQPPALLSGGYQMRVKLVKMLLAEPNLLLLDEPVNYLDLQTLILLEQFLQSYRGAYIIAAHDRTFLEHTCTETFEVEHGRLTTYRGSVSQYLSYKEEQKQFALKTNKKLRRDIAHNQVFVDRFRYKASLASRAQNKIKHIERLKRHLKNIEGPLTTVRMHIPSVSVPSGPALRVDNLSIGYGDVAVARNISFEVQRGEKVVIAGENGNGKSTLFKTLTGMVKPLSGSLKWWHRTTIGYYDQKTEATLIPTETVLQYLTRMAPADASAQRILLMAGSFLFRNDDLEKTTQVLSGGERARLCLAGVLLHEYNTLLLDEPTNHLDVETTEALACALKAYEGTVLVISHARTFVDALVSRIYELRAGTMRQFMGSYEAYVEGLVEDAREALLEGQPISENSEQKGQKHREVRELQRAQERLTKTIDALEKEKSEILAFFFQNPTDYSPHRSQRLAEIQQLLQEEEDSWLKMQSCIDELRGD